MRELIDSLRQEIESLPSTMQEEVLLIGVMDFFGLTEEAVLEMEDEELEEALLILAQTGLIEGVFKAGKLARAAQAVKTFAARHAASAVPETARKQTRKSAALSLQSARKARQRMRAKGTGTPEGAEAAGEYHKHRAKVLRMKAGGLETEKRLVGRYKEGERRWKEFTDPEKIKVRVPKRAAQLGKEYEQRAKKREGASIHKLPRSDKPAQRDVTKVTRRGTG